MLYSDPIPLILYAEFTYNLKRPVVCGAYE